MDAERQFIEKYSLYFEMTGFMRMGGRILAWLLICDPPHQTMHQLVEALQTSKSSISTATRYLIQAGFIERVSFSGQRRDYYRLHSDYISTSFERFVMRIGEMGRLVEHGMSILKGKPEERRQRLKVLHDYFIFINKEMPKLLKQWKDTNGGF
jgi:DNA-binding transcriptional regulator GbsR (MarR family)